MKKLRSKHCQIHVPPNKLYPAELSCTSNKSNCPKPANMNPSCFNLDCFSREYKDLADTPQLMNDLFVKHIQYHLKPDQDVICKICGMTVKEVFEEMKKRANLIEVEYQTIEEVEMALNTAYGPYGWYWADTLYTTSFDVAIINDSSKNRPATHVIFKEEGRYTIK